MDVKPIVRAFLVCDYVTVAEDESEIPTIHAVRHEFIVPGFPSPEVVIGLFFTIACTRKQAASIKLELLDIQEDDKVLWSKLRERIMPNPLGYYEGDIHTKLSFSHAGKYAARLSYDGEFLCEWPFLVSTHPSHRPDKIAHEEH